ITHPPHETRLQARRPTYMLLVTLTSKDVAVPEYTTLGDEKGKVADKPSWYSVMDPEGGGAQEILFKPWPSLTTDIEILVVGAGGPTTALSNAIRFPEPE